MKTSYLFTFALIILLGCIPALNTQAQNTKILAGGGLSFSTDIKSMGIQLNGVYQIDDTWEAAPGFTYYFKKDNTNWTMLDLNAHYVFHRDDKMLFYGLAGLNFVFWKVKIENVYYPDPMNPFSGYYDDWEANDTEVGFNLGAGGRMPITDQLWVTSELKYTIGGFDFLTINAGVLYHF